MGGHVHGPAPSIYTSPTLTTPSPPPPFSLADGASYVNDPLTFTDVGKLSRAFGAETATVASPLASLVAADKAQPSVVVAFLYSELSAMDVASGAVSSVATALNASATAIVAPFTFRTEKETIASFVAAAAATSTETQQRVVIAASSSFDAASVATTAVAGGKATVTDVTTLVESLESGPVADALFATDAAGRTNFLIVELGSKASRSLARDNALIARVVDVVARKSLHRHVCIATALRSAGAAARALASGRARRSLLATEGETWTDDFHRSDFLHMTPNIFLMICTTLMLAFFLFVALSVMFSIKTPEKFWTEGQQKESLHRPGLLDSGRTENDYVVQQRRVLG